MSNAEEPHPAKIISNDNKVDKLAWTLRHVEEMINAYRVWSIEERMGKR
jgi:hypothetical protein